MKIVQVTLRFDAPGGVETTVRELSRRLRSAGDEVQVYASDLVDESGWVRRSDFRPVVDGVPVRRFPIVKRPLPRVTLPVMAGLVDAISESGADIVHAHSHRYGHVLQSTFAAEKCRIPLVISTHFHPADRREPPLKKGLLRLEDVAFGMASYRVADALVVESELEGRLVREFSPGARIRIIPPGIDVHEWEDPSTDRTEELGLPAEYFLFVGRIAPNKGLPILVEALAGLSPADRIPLVLMGPDWGERTAIEQQARRLGIAELLRWLGSVPDRRAYRGVLRGARALALPSEWEAYGLVLLDAMAARTPIVASAVGAVPEVLDGGRAGRLVPYGDVVALREALRATTHEPDVTRRLVEVGIGRARAADWSVAVERHRALYRELART